MVALVVSVEVEIVIYLKNTGNTGGSGGIDGNTGGSGGGGGFK